MWYTNTITGVLAESLAEDIGSIPICGSINRKRFAMNKHFIKQYKQAMKKIINSESKTISQAIDAISKSEKIKENTNKKEEYK